MYFKNVSHHFHIDVQPSFECIVGSRSYNANDDDSDIDIISVVIPRLESLFFSHYNKIFGFDDYSIYSVLKNDIILNGLQLDYKLYNISVYLRHLMSGDVLSYHSLFVDPNCISVSNDVYYIIRNKRTYFLNKLLINNLKSKLDYCRSLCTNKSAYHYVRDVLFFYNVLKDEDPNLKNNSQLLKNIRHGVISFDEAMAYSNDMRLEIETSLSSKLQDVSPEYDVKKLLLNCIEQVHGSLAKFGF